MPDQLPEPYRYVTDTGSLRVHKVRDGVQELEERDWETICLWRFRAGIQPWVWGRHWIGIRRCAICHRGSEEDSSSDSEDQESAVSQ